MDRIVAAIETNNQLNTTPGLEFNANNSDMILASNDVKYQNDVEFDSTFRRNLKRTEFYSRPSWLFNINENILFCKLLQALKYGDQNNVPRKYLEQILVDTMAVPDTKWPAGAQFLSQTLDTYDKKERIFYSKRDSIVGACQKAQLQSAERKLKKLIRQRDQLENPRRRSNLADVTEIAPEIKDASDGNQDTLKASLDAQISELQDTVKRPIDQFDATAEKQMSKMDVALRELATKITRRIQGQTDRPMMVEEYSAKLYDEETGAYFAEVEEKARKEIDKAHLEIVRKREEVDSSHPKSRQSRIRRRTQVPMARTVSGSAARVRFTNREIAFLLHLIYTYSRDQWTRLINDYYTVPTVVRSPEHVRDKIRDLVSKASTGELQKLQSKPFNHAGPRKTADGKLAAITHLCENDLKIFTYPPFEYTPERNRSIYYNEELNEWREEVLPPGYARRYKEEIQRVHNVIRAKSGRTDKFLSQFMGFPQFPTTSGYPEDLGLGFFDSKQDQQAAVALARATSNGTSLFPFNLDTDVDFTNLSNSHINLGYGNASTEQPNGDMSDVGLLHDDMQTDLSNQQINGVMVNMGVNQQEPDLTEHENDGAGLNKRQKRRKIKKQDLSPPKSTPEDVDSSGESPDLNQQVDTAAAATASATAESDFDTLAGTTGFASQLDENASNTDHITPENHETEEVAKPKKPRSRKKRSA